MMAWQQAEAQQPEQCHCTASQPQTRETSASASDCRVSSWLSRGSQPARSQNCEMRLRWQLESAAETFMDMSVTVQAISQH